MHTPQETNKLAPSASYISQIEERSGIKFNEAMVALARQWIGESRPVDPVNVTIVLPTETPATDPILNSAAGKDKTGKKKEEPKTETYALPETVENARHIIETFEEGALGLRSDEPVSDNVVQHMLGDRTGLLDEAWLGTEEEEKNAYVSELLYIHSKVMIVDDRRVIVSSFFAPCRCCFAENLSLDGFCEYQRP